MKKLLLLLLFSVALGLSLQAQKFTAFLSKKQVAVNETFEVSFKIDNGNGRVNFPKFNGLQVVGGPNTGSSMQFVNGQMSQSYTYSFYVRAPKAGTVTIGEASVKVNGKTLKSKPLSVKVVKGNAQAAPQQNARGQQGGGNAANADLMKQIADNVFLKAFLSKKETYLGEQVTLTYKLYSRVSIVNLNEEDPPKFNGFWVENVKDGNVQFVNEVLNGVQYQSAIVRKVILFPQRSGKLEINPYKLKTVVRVRTNSRRSRNIFESVFGGVQDVPFIATATPINITVNPLPAGKPADFDGAVGTFTLKASIDKEETQTGDPITLKVKLSGTGNIKNIKEPNLQFPTDFEVYDPKVDQRVSTASGVVSGQKSFDYLIIPRNPGDYKLPPVSFSYFDPKAKTYKTLNSPEFIIKATGEALGATVTTINIHKDEVELLSQDIRYIKTDTPVLRQKGQTFWGSGSFWLLSLLPFMCFAGLFWYKRQQEAASQDVVGTRMKKATRLAKKRLEAAQKLMASQEENQFYDEVVRATWGYLGDKLALGQSELSRDEVRKQLAARGVTEPNLDTLQEVLDTCEMALFAPTAVEGGMQATYDKAVQLISDLEGELK